jgi:hypothetical protein
MIMKFLFTKLSPAQVAAMQLHQAEIELLEVEKQREYFNAVAPMMQMRVSRLRSALSRSVEAEAACQ